MACNEFGPGRLAEPPADPRRDRRRCSAPMPQAAGRPARAGHQRADARADRPGALHRQPQQRPAGPRDRRRPGRARRAGDAGQRPGEHRRPARRGRAPCRDRRADAGRLPKPRCRPTSRSSPPRSPTGAWRTRPSARSRRRPARAPPALELVPNPDILATLAAAGPRRPAPGRRLRRRDRRRCSDHAAAKLRAQGLRLDRRQRRHRRHRHHGRDGERGAAGHRPPASRTGRACARRRSRGAWRSASPRRWRERCPSRCAACRTPRVCRCRAYATAGRRRDGPARCGRCAAHHSARRARAGPDRPRHRAAAGYEVQVRPRSGLALQARHRPAEQPRHRRRGLSRRAAGDRAERRATAPFVVERGKRIAQVVLAPVVRARWQEVADLPGTARGEGGFGSTGTR